MRRLDAVNTVCYDLFLSPFRFRSGLFEITEVWNGKREPLNEQRELQIAKKRRSRVKADTPALGMGARSSLYASNFHHPNAENSKLAFHLLGAGASTSC